MRCGLFGKLPAKRDFIAPGVPRELLAVFEPWLQASLAASRFALGTRWQAAFLRAPIWRFWLGRDLCGGAVIGALMPSVDGVGRYFPLTLVARAEAGEDLAPPDIDPHETWLDAAEQILLAALSPDADLEQLIGALDRLGPPRASRRPGTGASRRSRRRAGARRRPARRRPCGARSPAWSGPTGRARRLEPACGGRSAATASRPAP